MDKRTTHNIKSLSSATRSAKSPDLAERFFIYILYTSGALCLSLGLHLHKNFVKSCAFFFQKLTFFLSELKLH
jgi:hypothetical protein